MHRNTHMETATCMVHRKAQSCQPHRLQDCPSPPASLWGRRMGRGWGNPVAYVRRDGQTCSLFGRHRDNPVSRPTLPLYELLAKLTPETVPNAEAGANFAMVVILSRDHFIYPMPLLRFICALSASISEYYGVLGMAVTKPVFKISGP